MSIFTPSLFLLFFLTLTLSMNPAAPAPVQAQERLTIGLLPEMNVFKQRERFEPLARYLAAQTGVQVELTMLSRYGNIIDRLKSGKIDAAFLGSFTGALAILQFGAEPLARPVNPDGKVTYHGLIFVRRDSGINTVADMQGKRLALVEKATTAGYVFPLVYLKKHGVTDLSFFREHYFLGSHDATIRAVLSGQADVGAAKNTIFEYLRKSEPRIDRELIVLAASAPVPSNGLLVRPRLEARLKTKLREALVSLQTDPAGGPVLAALGYIGFAPAGREDYQSVINMAAEAGIDLGKYSYQNK